MTFKLRIADKRACRGAGVKGGLSCCEEEWQGLMKVKPDKSVTETRGRFVSEPESDAGG